jgi:dynein heavy chain
MGNKDIPEVGIEFSAKSEIFRSYTLNLEKTVDWYNKIVKNCSKVELELIKDEIVHIDDLLEKALSELNWTSESECF